LRQARIGRLRIGIIAFPTGLRFGRRTVGIGPVLYLCVALGTLVAELALVQRQVPLFGSDFRRFHALDTWPERALFFAALVPAQLLLVHLVYRLLRFLHGRRADSPLFYFNFLFFATAAIAAILATRFRILSYFSEAISFQIIRNLGGGSLVQALLYVADEAGFLIVGFAVAAAVYGACYLLLGLGRTVRQRPPPARPRFRFVALAGAGIALLLFQAGRSGDVRSALDRFLAPYLLYAALDQATDLDRDGYSLFSHQRDAQPLDPARHPFALDIPDNGIDEDGFNGDFSWRGGSELVPTPAIAAPRRHVVLVVLESTRADALTKVFAGRRVAPNMAAMAATGTWVPEAYSHVGYTRNSLKSLFTGRLDPLDDRQSLFRDFKRNGYRVGVLSGQAEDFGGIAATAAMRSNSDVFIDAKVLEKERVWSFLQDIALIVDGKALLREMDRHFGAREGWRQPTFLYFNIQAAHFPYDFPGTLQLLPGRPIPRSEIGSGDRPRISRTYWNAVAYGDWLLGRIVARLKALGVYDNTVVVVLGDHGEELFENGYLGHGQVLNRLQTHIPLVFSQPGIAVRGPVGLADLRGIMLRAAGAQLPPPAPREAVFQYIGDLNRPPSIAMVEPGGVWTSLDFQTEEVTAGNGRYRAAYRTLPPGGVLRRKADRLIAIWERERLLQRDSASR
jgi:phosphoglycerol transferase MdoB-like AlkP superfamily enzyme